MLQRAIRYLALRAGKDYTGPYRAVALLLGGTLFLAGWPALIWIAAGAPAAAVWPQHAATGLTAAAWVVGVPWMLWAVFWQLSRGKGTPVPVVPTKHLLQTGPYRYVRNPMMFGHTLYLLGWAALFNRWGGYVCATALAALLMLEIRLIEERELELRFGEAYRQYKRDVPFWIPRMFRRNRG